MGSGVRRLATAVVIVFAAIAPASCAGGDSSGQSPGNSAARSVAEPSLTPTEAVLDVPDDVDPEGLVFAADLLTTGGSVTKAVADGFVTQSEIDAAQAALDSGELADIFD